MVVFTFHLSPSPSLSLSLSLSNICISATSDLLASWEELETELTERLGLCEKYRSVTAEIETAASKLEVLLKQRKKLDCSEDEDIDLRKDSAQVRGPVKLL